MDSKNYFIKENYICNAVKSFDIDDSDYYWTENRIKKSMTRQYHVYQIAYSIFRDNKLESVIDVGSGPGTKMKKFFGDSSEKVFLLDQPSISDIVKNTFPNAEFVSADLSKVVTMDQEFDLVICSDVIEHLEDPDILMRTLKGFLKGDGFLVLSTPDRDVTRGPDNFQSPNSEHVREWNFEELDRYVQSHGFQIEEHVNLPSGRLNAFQLFLQKYLLNSNIKEQWYRRQALVARLV